jgi:putative tryptophan/tyrosine transport system substrate-binding protein
MAWAKSSPFRKDSSAPRRSGKDLRSSAGSTAAMFRSIFNGCSAARRRGRALQQLGWSDRHNVRIDYRWAAGDAGRFHRYAEELLALVPDVILASATPSVQALQQATRTVPICSLLSPTRSAPGGNVTGFTPFEHGISGKWLELIKEIAPRTTRVAMFFNPSTASYAEVYLDPFKAAAGP